MHDLVIDMDPTEIYERLENMRGQLHEGKQRFGKNVFLRRASVEATDDRLNLRRATETALESAELRGFVAGYLLGQWNLWESQRK